MNCKPVPTLDERINDIRLRTAEIVNADILPNERLWAEQRPDETWTQRTAVLELRAEIKDKVKRAALWAPHLPTDYGDMGLDFLTHAYTKRGPRRCRGRRQVRLVAPNSGNQSLLVKYGTDEQKRQWLIPLIEGTMEPGFSMTEPHNAGSDPHLLDPGGERSRRSR